MANSTLMSNNEEYVRDAINNGISAGAVSNTVEDMLKKSEEIGAAPKQVKESIETIADMKKDLNSELDMNYSSELVKNNSNKIKSALNEGIGPDEVAITLINSTNNANNKRDKKHLNFIVKLISKMKRKELVLDRQNTNEKSYQKIKQ